MSSGDLSTSEHIHGLGEKYRTEILKELHAYYREELGMDDYATRIGELMMLIQMFEVSKFCTFKRKLKIVENGRSESTIRSNETLQHNDRRQFRVSTEERHWRPVAHIHVKASILFTNHECIVFGVRINELLLQKSIDSGSQRSPSAFSYLLDIHKHVLIP